MEVEAARIIFARNISVQKYNLRYTAVVCDCDAKTINTLNDMKVYTLVRLYFIL